MKKIIYITLLLASIGSLSATVAYKPPTEKVYGYNASTTTGVEITKCEALDFNYTMYCANEQLVLPVVASEVSSNTSLINGKGILAKETEFYLFRIGYLQRYDEKLPDIYRHIKKNKLYLLNCQLAFK